MSYDHLHHFQSGAIGIGLSIAKALEFNGAERVYIVGRRLDVLENATKQSVREL
jgi:short-subunit dehydrogenase involved in D-alanine esterification of teichoic acids